MLTITIIAAVALIVLILLFYLYFNKIGKNVEKQIHANELRVKKLNWSATNAQYNGNHKAKLT